MFAHCTNLAVIKFLIMNTVRTNKAEAKLGVKTYFFNKLKNYNMEFEASLLIHIILNKKKPQFEVFRLKSRANQLHGIYTC